MSTHERASGFRSGFRQLLVVVAVAGGLAGGARAEGATIFAAMVGGVNVCAVDNNAFVCGFGTQISDLDPALGQLALGNAVTPINIGGLQFLGSISTQTLGATDILSFSSLEVSNPTASTIAAVIAVGATDFSGPVDTANASGSGTFVDAIGSIIILQWFNDPNNAQGAEAPFDRPGNLLSTFADAATVNPDSFAFNSGPIPVLDPNLFSMTLGIEFTLTPGGRLLSLGQAEIKLQQGVPAPEPALLALFGVGALGAAVRRRRVARR